MYHTGQTIDTGFFHVLPRDAYNVSKLLKCIGRLTILIHEGFGLNDMQFEHDGEPFVIGLVSDGHLTVMNITFTLNETPLFFKTTYNSKENYPLFCEYDSIDYEVFDEEGNYTEEFKEFCEELSKAELQ